MDDVNSLCDEMSLGVGVTENHSMKVLQAHPHMALYKNKGKALDQEKRRQKELDLQKKKRFDAFNHARQLAGCDFLTDEEEDIETKQLDNQDFDNQKYKRLTHGGQFYRNQLMLAEWLLYIPPTFSEEYCMKLCPVGRHVLVVAAKGRTRVFTKSGHLLKTFQSHLPGGGRKDESYNQRKRSFTVLDCFLSTPEENVLYVCDVMAWRETVYYDFETYSRFEWLENYYSMELESESQSSIRFQVLPSYSCDEDTMKDIFSQPSSIKVDGVLFYHRFSHYILGSTSLVGWLKPYMIPELLPTIVSDIHPDYKWEQPPNYIDHKQDMINYNETRKQLLASLKTSPNAGGKPSRMRHNTSENALSDFCSPGQTMDTADIG